MKPLKIQNVVVLGSGVMGSQIAAHCVNAGLNVRLLDMKSDEPERADKIAEEGLANLQKMKPAPIALPDYVKRIRPGNFEDDLAAAGEADWICEAVVERMDVKRDLMARLEKVRRPGTVVSTNTSGLLISEISEGRSEEFRRHFLGTHFFNPPRYMKLLEVIPTHETDSGVAGAMTRFCERILGKGVVRCKDTPNFIGNRLGVFSIASIMPWYFNGTFRAEEIDELTGTLTGYSKAATFRTCDMVGLDVLDHVASNLYPAIPEDERREIFRLPDGFGRMVEKGWLGNKSGQGFYRKVKTEKGSEYHQLNPSTLAYEPRMEAEMESVEMVRQTCPTPEERLKVLISRDDKAGRFLWEIQCDLLLYAANRIPEISDSVESLDRAMQWGYNWLLGPFQRWDAIGVRESAERMKKEGRVVPEMVWRMLESGRERFYEQGTVYDPGTGEVKPLTPPAEGAVTASALAAGDRELWGNGYGGLYDMGEGVALFEFRTKQQTLGSGLVETLLEACEKVRQESDALVIGHDGENFSYGADLKEAVKVIRNADWKRMEQLVRNFQEMAVGLRNLPIPVVGAVSGRAFGGAVELFMHCDRVVAHHELYSGLVEFGVGLIPAGGGTKEMLLRSMSRMAGESDSLPFLKEAFTTIGMAKVSDSAAAARRLGYLRSEDIVVMNRDLLLVTACKQAWLLAEAGYRPPPEPMVSLSGKTGFSALQVMLYNLEKGGFITSYDALLGEHVARIMTGGELSEPQEVPESVLLKMERETILELFREKRTLERMEHMLEKGKPLRN